MEYAPLETAWTPVVGDRFLLYILPLDAGRYGRLMEERIADARAEGLAGRSALCGEIRLSADETEDGHTLLALSFDGAALCFAGNAQRRVAWDELTICYDGQRPFIARRVERAKALPGVFSNWAVFHKGRFVTLNQIDAPAIDRLIAP